MSKSTKQSSQKTHKLHLGRVIVFLLLLGGLGLGMVGANQRISDSQASGNAEPWYGGYVDATATPTYNFEELETLPHNKNVVLSFIVADSEDPCTPTWGNAYNLSEAGTGLDLDRRVARLRQQDGTVAISFGGLLNDELAVVCEDEEALLNAYNSVIERYVVDTIDLDLEGTGLTDQAAGARRARVLSKLQAIKRSEGGSLAIWATVPVSTDGLSEDGTNAVSTLLAGGVDLIGVNAMTMNFGDSRADGESMFEASRRALESTHRQLSILYEQADIELSPATIWAKIGATPMLGQNDIRSEVFTFADAEKLNEFARENGINRVSFWSANRDRPCGGNYVDLSTVSDSCSGVEVDAGEFGRVLSEGFDASLSASAGVVTERDEDFAARDLTDDPASSPYQIWSADGAYLQGTKVVWHRNVYEAKWWTQGDLPDDPVLQTWQTPWQLIGPVLPGETPIELPSLPAGTYPDWEGAKVYQAGARVLFDAAPYQAKWWTQGDSPAAASSNADASPWAPLSQAEIEEILAER